MMRNTILLIALAAGLSTACGSANENSVATDNSSNRSAANTSQALQEVPTTPQNSTTNRTIVDVNEKDAMTSSPPPGVKPYERDALENSTYSSSLGTTALEVRTFKKHPQIARVEKTIDGTKQAVKVFLKNGKTIDIDPEKLPNIATASSAAILEAAGMKAPQTGASSGPPKGETVP